jgi:hypothetical protein
MQRKTLRYPNDYRVLPFQQSNYSWSFFVLRRPANADTDENWEFIIKAEFYDLESLHEWFWRRGFQVPDYDVPPGFTKPLHSYEILEKRRKEIEMARRFTVIQGSKPEDAPPSDHPPVQWTLWCFGRKIECAPIEPRAELPLSRELERGPYAK